MQTPDPLDQWWIKLIAFTILAAIGGAIGHLFRIFENGHKFSLTIFIVKTLSAAFTGCLMYLLCIALNFSPVWTGICVGVFGWLGADATIKVLKSFVYNMLNVDKQEKNNDSNSSK